MSQHWQATITLTLNIEAGDELDRDALDQLTRQLHRELLELDVEAVDFIQEGTPPKGTKTSDAVTIGALAVAVLPTLLPKVIEFLQTWSLRGEGRKVKVKSQVGDRSIEVEYTHEAMSLDDLKNLVDTLTGTLTDSDTRE